MIGDRTGKKRVDRRQNNGNKGLIEYRTIDMKGLIEDRTIDVKG